MDRDEETKRNGLMLGMWSFTADTRQCAPFSAPAAWISTGRSDAVVSLGLTRWSSRISCISGDWFLAGMNKTKPLREVTRTDLMRDFTHSGGTWKNCCNAWGGGRWTIGRRAFFRTLVLWGSSKSRRRQMGCHTFLR